MAKRGDFPIVEVEWEDSGCKHGWASDLATQSLIYSVGHLVKDEPKGITLTESIDTGEHHAEWGCSLAIPRSAVRKVYVLRQSNKKAK